MQKTVQTPNPYTQAWSFTRYSTKGQNAKHGGSSEQRQDANFTRVCREYNWTQYDYRMLLDGISGFKKDKNGERKSFKYLRKVVDDLRSGVLKKNVPMVVEKTSRFGRGDMDEAYQILREIIINGCPVWIEGILLDKEALNDNEKTATVRRRMADANEYSKTLSGFVSEGLQIRIQKLMDGERFMENAEGETVRILLNHLPSWVVKDTWTVDPRIAEIIKQIFADYLGGMGATAIAQKLNASKVETLSGTGAWSQSFIYRLLSDRRLIGEVEVMLNNEPIKIAGYLPVVVDTDTFDKAVAKLAANANKRPVGVQPSGKVANIASGILFCVCGSKIKLGHGKGGDSCTCYTRHNEGVESCNQPMMQYAKVEAGILNLLKLNPGQLMSDDDTVQNQINILRGRKAGIKTEIKKLNEMIESLPLEKLGAALPALNTRLENYKKQISEIDSQIIIEGSKAVSSKDNLDKLTGVLANLQNITTDHDFRKTVNQWFISTFKKITLDKKAQEFMAELSNGNIITMGLDGSIKGKKSLHNLTSLNNGIYDRVKTVLHHVRTKTA